jgi:hypothetical protein
LEVTFVHCLLISEFSQLYKAKQYRQRTYDLTSRRVLVTAVAAETQKLIVCVLSSYTSLSTVEILIVSQKCFFLANLCRRQQ